MSRVLLVDDEVDVLRAFKRMLDADGHDITTAGSGDAAIDAVRTTSFNVIVSDLSMPGMSGIDLLRAVRQTDLDVPIIVLTGSPALETAIQAMEYGAMRYLVKPVAGTLFRSVVKEAGQLHELALVKREALAVVGDAHKLLGDRAGLEACFSRALESVWMAYQPIVRWSDRSVYAHEALLRSTEPALPNPVALIDAAERLDRVFALSRKVRTAAAGPVAAEPEGPLLFVNLHPRDLLDDELFNPNSPLSKIASRVTLEITERASLASVSDVARRVADLRKLGFRIAVDDLGAGYAGLSSFAQLEPEVVKLDMALVRDVDKSATKRRLIGGMVRICGEMKIDVVSEGVETAAERDVLCDLGVDLMQGYFFARPGRPFPTAVF